MATDIKNKAPLTKCSVSPNREQHGPERRELRQLQSTQDVLSLAEQEHAAGADHAEAGCYPAAGRLRRLLGGVYADGGELGRPEVMLGVHNAESMDGWCQWRSTRGGVD